RLFLRQQSFGNEAPHRAPGGASRRFQSRRRDRTACRRGRAPHWPRDPLAPEMDAAASDHRRRALRHPRRARALLVRQPRLRTRVNANPKRDGPAKIKCVMARLARAPQPRRVRAANESKPAVNQEFLARVDTRALGGPLKFTLGPREARTRARAMTHFFCTWCQNKTRPLF